MTIGNSGPVKMVNLDSQIRQLFFERRHFLWLKISSVEAILLVSQIRTRRYHNELLREELFPAEETGALDMIRWIQQDVPRSRIAEEG